LECYIGYPIADFISRKGDNCHIKGISINGYYLHKVEMLTEPYSDSTVSYLRYPNIEYISRLKGINYFLKFQHSYLLNYTVEGFFLKTHRKVFR